MDDGFTVNKDSPQLGVTEMAETSTKDLLRETEAAALLTMRPQTLAVWRSRNYGPPFVRIGRSVRYRADELVKFLDRHTVATSE